MALFKLTMPCPKPNDPCCSRCDETIAGQGQLDVCGGNPAVLKEALVEHVGGPAGLVDVGLYRYVGQRQASGAAFIPPYYFFPFQFVSLNQNPALFANVCIYEWKLGASTLAVTFFDRLVPTNITTNPQPPNQNIIPPGSVRATVVLGSQSADFQLGKFPTVNAAGLIAFLCSASPLQAVGGQHFANSLTIPGFIGVNMTTYVLLAGNPTYRVTMLDP